jgi:hypothetical protein
MLTVREAMPKAGAMNSGRSSSTPLSCYQALYYKL